MTEPAASAAGPGREETAEPHASDKTYVGIAAILAVLTALEVMVFYIPALKGWLYPILIVLMVSKFSLVVLFFMHLKYDDTFFRGLFTGPLLISAAVVLAMLAIFGKLLTRAQ